LNPGIYGIVLPFERKLSHPDKDEKIRRTGMRIPLMSALGIQIRLFHQSIFLALELCVQISPRGVLSGKYAGKEGKASVFE
jgi:hypothetical protein